ncbi:MAG: hypothetical protein IPN17_31015 [Deltaproteobacteria bacterium]|nr:hypothetical protein [Deltaproteobacteria bacterium]
MCAHSGLRVGARCTRTVRERLPPHVSPPQVCDAHDALGHDLVDARFARWAQQHHAAVVSRGTEVAAPLRVVMPEDGTRLLAGRAGDRLRLRAEGGGAEPEGVRWEVDGRAVDASWEMTPGRHVAEVITAEGARTERVRGRPGAVRAPRCAGASGTTPATAPERASRPTPPGSELIRRDPGDPRAPGGKLPHAPPTTEFDTPPLGSNCTRRRVSPGVDDARWSGRRGASSGLRLQGHHRGTRRRYSTVPLQWHYGTLMVRLRRLGPLGTLEDRG